MICVMYQWHAWCKRYVTKYTWGTVDETKRGEIFTVKYSLGVFTLSLPLSLVIAVTEV